MRKNRWAFLAIIMILGSAQVFAWTEYKPVMFVGNMQEIYSKIPVFHGYTSEFLNSAQVKQVCTDAGNDGVKLNYCK